MENLNEVDGLKAEIADLKVKNENLMFTVERQEREKFQMQDEIYSLQNNLDRLKRIIEGNVVSQGLGGAI